MCINWEIDGAEMKEFIAMNYGSASRSIINSNSYFKKGLTYQYTGKTFRVHPLPADSIITMAGQGLYTDSKDWYSWIAILNTKIVTSLLKSINPGRFFQASYVNALPAPINWEKNKENIVDVGKVAVECQMELSREQETSSLFIGFKFNDSLVELSNNRSFIQKKIDEIAVTIDKISENIYNISPSGFQEIDNDLEDEEFVASEEGEENLLSSQTLVQYVFGVTIGRWDIRYATGERPAPELPDPFAPLPICPPGMLQGDDGLPLTHKEGLKLRVAGYYPLDITWGGILVDDPGHPLDLEHRFREVFTVLWHDRADSIEQEACDILGVKNLRDYFRKPSGFFADHLKRYSKSRRQAPIYWPLSTTKGSYTLWVYYHRLSDQTLHTALADFVDPKLKDVRAEISLLRESNNNRSRLEELLDLEGELLDFRAEIERIIKLPWQPNLNDGVLITAAPLWRLFRLPKWQKDLKACWDKLEKGEYDWAHLAYSIWPKRVEEVCKKDRSIAIAHGLEHLCQVEPPKPKAKRGRKKAE